QSWDIVMKAVDALDEDLMRGYKEDIDTLLVFAGLFSAVVTAFTIESYQWLKEDPNDTAVVLLKQISHWQMNNQPLPPDPPFAPTSTDIRINTFWFLSLTLALVDALFGLLCKQWVREHQRQTNTHSPGEALALRWLRYQSFEHWHVHQILAALPMLLEIALFLFLAGLLELLWTRHHIPFFTSLAIVGIAGTFYIITTILPGLSIIWQILRIDPSLTGDRPQLYPSHISHLLPLHLICPYKSPQSWLIFRLFSTIFHGFNRLLCSFFVKSYEHWKHTSRPIQGSDPSSWSAVDLDVIQRFSRIAYCPDLYQLKGFRWLVEETQDIPSMIPHLKNVL
ncbi:hypothetical protein L218DRAFT_831732, partial [Marasmius fiardii PR-910]